MPSVLILFFLVNTCISISAQNYNLFKLLDFKKNLIKYSTTSTPIIYSTKIINKTDTIVHQAELVKEKIENYVTSTITIASAILCAIAAIYSFVIFVIKCYKNNCRVKKSWFKIKSPSEYGRRNVCRRQREIILDEFIQQRDQASSYSDEMV
ncbi:hypothetical protein I4U23_005163 [Adineta vaga]|nr:hypothetical protein I4U23_005163 [Adineta vaga]